MPLSADIGTTLLEARHLVKRYAHVRRGKEITVVNDVSFTLARQRTLGIIGESGCGKSTLAKMLMQIEKLNAGELYLHAKPYAELDPTEFRHSIQMIFQDCYGSLNPRRKAIDIVSEPLRVNSQLSAQECRQRAQEVLTQVGLTSVYWHRFPHMFSGGQRQRIGIARAIITRPQIVICDEPVSALDISVQAQIINLLMSLQKKYQLSYILISHDLAVVHHISDDILVMYFGKVAEYGGAAQVFARPRHPYTQALLDSTARIATEDKPKQPALRGELPSPFDPPRGCAFHTRCPRAQQLCREQVPALRHLDDTDTQVACHFAE